jgi:hypothetical protein
MKVEEHKDTKYKMQKREEEWEEEDS